MQLASKQRRARPGAMLPSGSRPPAASAVRVTVEEDDSAEEVEDIGSAATSSSSELDEDSGKTQQQQQKSKKRSPDTASGAAGLANVLRGLLTKTVRKDAAGCPILAKALTDRQRFAPAAAGKALADADDEDDDDDHDGKGRTAPGVASVSARRRLTAEHRRWLCAGRVKCGRGAPGEREADRELERIACRGVVQLFNVVRTQQRALDARLAGKSEAGRQRVLGALSKADFLDMLAGRKKRQQDGKLGKDNDDEEEEDEQENSARKSKRLKKSWGVLSEDYLVKPTLTMKDWDRASTDSGSDAGGGEQQPMEEGGAGSD